MSEILGALFSYVIKLLGVAAVVLLLYAVFGADKTNNALSQISQTQSNIQALYVSQPNFSSLNNSVVINGQLAPSDMIQGNALVNGWNGPVTVAVDSNTSQFSLTETQVPKSACIKLSANVAAYVSLQINGGTAYGTASGTKIDPGIASTECAAGGDNNSLKFVFAR